MIFKKITLRTIDFETNKNQIIVHPKQFSFENGIMKIPPYMIPCL